MTTSTPLNEDPIDALVARGLTQLRASAPQSAELLADADVAARVAQVIAASDFALETLRRQPDLLRALASDAGAQPVSLPVLSAEDVTIWPEQLRRYRAAGSTRLVWRDVLGLDSVEATLAGRTERAARCVQRGLQCLEW
mgnify:FL=1